MLNYCHPECIFYYHDLRQLHRWLEVIHTHLNLVSAFHKNIHILRSVTVCYRYLHHVHLMIFLFMFCEVTWLWNTWRLNNIWSFISEINLVGWATYHLFSLNALVIMVPCNCTKFSRTDVVPVIPPWNNNALNIPSPTLMSFSFSTYFFMTICTHYKCISNMPRKFCALVKTHPLIVGPSYTEFK